MPRQPTRTVIWERTTAWDRTAGRPRGSSRQHDPKERGTADRGNR